MENSILLQLMIHTVITNLNSTYPFPFLLHLIVFSDGEMLATVVELPPGEPPKSSILLNLLVIPDNINSEDDVPILEYLECILFVSDR